MTIWLLQSDDLPIERRRKGKIEQTTIYREFGQSIECKGLTKDMFDANIFHFLLADGWELTLTQSQFSNTDINEH